MKHLVPNYIQRPSLPITITVIGVGGSGSMFLQHLARIVYAYTALTRRKICVIACDGDEVDYTNIGRQAFGPNETGHNKAELIVSRINRFYGFKWLCRPAHFDYSLRVNNDKNEIFAELSSNFIISAVDSVGVRKKIRSFFMKGQEIKNNPEYFPWFWLDMGSTKTTGNVIVGSPEMEWPDIMSYAEYFPKDTTNEPSCSLAEALGKQDLFINSQCALIAAKWLWECLSNKVIDWRGAFINLESLTIRKIKIPINAPTKRDRSTKLQRKPVRKPAKIKRGTRPAKKGKVKDSA